MLTLRIVPDLPEGPSGWGRGVKKGGLTTRLSRREIPWPTPKKPANGADVKNFAAAGKRGMHPEAMGGGRALAAVQCEAGGGALVIRAMDVACEQINRL